MVTGSLDYARDDCIEPLPDTQTTNVPRCRRDGDIYNDAVLPRENDVFFRPGVHLLTMRAGQLVILQRRVRVEIFIDR